MQSRDMRGRRRRRKPWQTGGAAFALLFAGALGSCRHPEKLRVPSIRWSHEWGFCGQQVGVDAGDVLWAEQGCENGKPKMGRRRRLKAAEVEKLKQAVRRLPQDRPILSAEEHADIFNAVASLIQLEPDHCYSPAQVIVTDAQGESRTWSMAKCEPPTPTQPE